MTAFDPKIALRILAEKQQRLYDEAWAVLRKGVWMGVTRPSTYNSQEWKELDSIWNTKSRGADGIWKAIHYLKNRIEEEAL